ncbi:hypothetical protein SNEBB_003545 [Seison nebaliae]|nr:hypothetical protein SNEBB_003545 [Seison nebaliae]
MDEINLEERVIFKKILKNIFIKQSNFEDIEENGSNYLFDTFHQRDCRNSIEFNGRRDIIDSDVLEAYRREYDDGNITEFLRSAIRRNSSETKILLDNKLNEEFQVEVETNLPDARTYRKTPVSLAILNDLSLERQKLVAMTECGMAMNQKLIRNGDRIQLFDLDSFNVTLNSQGKNITHQQPIHINPIKMFKISQTPTDEIREVLDDIIDFVAEHTFDHIFNSLDE